MRWPVARMTDPRSCSHSRAIARGSVMRGRDCGLWRFPPAMRWASRSGSGIAPCSVVSSSRRAGSSTP